MVDMFQLHNLEYLICQSIAGAGCRTWKIKFNNIPTFKNDQWTVEPTASRFTLHPLLPPSFLFEKNCKGKLIQTPQLWLSLSTHHHTKTTSVSLCAVFVTYTYSAQRQQLLHTHTFLLQPLQMCRNPQLHLATPLVSPPRNVDDRAANCITTEWFTRRSHKSLVFAACCGCSQDALRIRINLYNWTGWGQ